MSVEIKLMEPDDHGDNVYCINCGCTSPDAKITSEYIKIPICEDCVKEFINSCQEVLVQINNQCHCCKHFKPNEWDRKKYCGSCNIKGADTWYDTPKCDRFERSGI